MLLPGVQRCLRRSAPLDTGAGAALGSTPGAWRGLQRAMAVVAVLRAAMAAGAGGGRDTPAT
eukprot:8744706-Alexandrium_andersonii.AAC.1